MIKRALFICSRNRWRSPTAEQVFSTWMGVETDSAGLAPDAEVVLSLEQIEWATVIFVMEESHRSLLVRRFSGYLREKKVICLNIPDQYRFMQPELIEALENSAGPHLKVSSPIEISRVTRTSE